MCRAQRLPCFTQIAENVHMTRLNKISRASALPMGLRSFLTCGFAFLRPSVGVSLLRPDRQCSQMVPRLTYPYYQQLLI